ncbi:cation diffusion facilitator family transporter [Thermodesulfovibrio yellowstonii]|uniref:cation diffusion facilitator family transporter n=1 Tax=Thermodesulfovibrio yellowstonii TaxID=28262 RepID=UPI003C7BF4DB
MKEKIIDSIIKIFKLEKGDKNRNFGFFEGIISTIFNFFIFLIKYLFSNTLNSISLKADAFHTLSDILTSIIVIIGFYFASKKADKKHPFGHGRIEKIFSILMAIILIYVGYEFFISSLDRFKNPVNIDINYIAILILFITILIKEFLTLISLELGKRINSLALKTDAWHHRSDSIATLLIIVGFFTFKFGLYFLDGVFGMAVSVLIAYTGFSIILQSSSFLIGEEPSADLVKKINDIAYNFDYVEDVHHIHIHDYGNQIEITFHIRLKGDQTLNEVHDKITRIEEAIENEIKGANVTIHSEPLK